MTAILMFLAGNWELLVYGLAVVIALVLLVVGFIKLPKKVKSERVRKNLLLMVLKAEKSMGEGTGEMKLLDVYNKFTGRYPVLSLFITFDNFKKLVDESLETMKATLNKNERLKEYIEAPDEVIVDTIQPLHLDSENVNVTECAYCGQEVELLEDFNGEVTCESCYQYMKKEME